MIAPKPRKLDLRTEYLKQRYSLHPEWVWHSFKALEDPGKHSQWEGGVYREAIQRGKRKGATNYSKPMVGTEATVIMSDPEFEAWLPQWERMVGKCHECKGTGAQWIGWHHITGDKTQPCPRCAASGLAPAQGTEAGTAATAQTGAVHDGPVPTGCAQ